jgi:hypothetical protein
MALVLANMVSLFPVFLDGSSQLGQLDKTLGPCPEKLIYRNNFGNCFRGLLDSLLVVPELRSPPLTSITPLPIVLHLGAISSNQH